MDLSGFPRSSAYRSRCRQVRSRDRNTCQVCGSTRRIEVDHVIPRFLGGNDDIDNLRCLCAPCNKIKGGSMMTDAEILHVRRTMTDRPDTSPSPYSYGRR